MQRNRDQDPVPLRPLVSVLTPVRNEERDLPDVIASMRRQTIGNRVEFLFIDGASADGTASLLDYAAAQDPRVRLLANPARRTPQALNIGLRAARGTYVARMDAHTIYPADYLATGVSRLEVGDVSWVSGPQLPVGRGPWSRRAALALSTRLGMGGASFRRATTNEIETDSGFTGVWQKSLLDELGGWDEGWPINQDAELAARIRDRGLRILCLPDMAAEYIPRESLAALARQYWGYGRYRCKTAVRHPRSLRRSHVLAPGLVAVAGASLLPGRLGRTPRRLLIVYPIALLATVASLARKGRPADAAGAGMVLAVMHFSWGAGFIDGMRKWGVPWRGLLTALGLRRALFTLASTGRQAQ